MIKNEREYRITKTHLAGFEGGLVANDKREFPPNVDPGMKKLMHDAIASEIEVLRSQVDHYERLREGRITGREITSLHELPVRVDRSPHRRKAHPAPTCQAHRSC